MGLTKYLAKIAAGAMALGGIFYMAGGAADALGVPGVTAAAAGAFGLLAGIAYGLASAEEKQ